MDIHKLYKLAQNMNKTKDIIKGKKEKENKRKQMYEYVHRPEPEQTREQNLEEAYQDLVIVVRSDHHKNLSHKLNKKSA